MRRISGTLLRNALLATSCLAALQLAGTGAALAGGVSGGHVVTGSASITSGGNSTVVKQSSGKALINWQSFSIPSNSSVTFEQPGQHSLTVNRVVGPGSSQIFGALTANGNLWLINSNGILFGKGSQIDVGALIATTSDITDDDWKNGRTRFAVASQNPNASVVNQGTIRTAPGGSVVLSAPVVSNQGLIQANLGTVALGSANAFTVDLTGDNLIRYEVTAPVTSTPTAANGSPASALVSNAGTIEANGGSVLMTARAAQSVQDNVINNTGMVEATSVSSHNGEIVLDAGDGTVNAGGTLDASGKAAGQKGGDITVVGNTVNIANGATLDASGDRGGGEIRIGGGLHGGEGIAQAQQTNVGNASLNANATTQGNGGSIVVWSKQQTSFDGTASAQGGAAGGSGGMIETSGGNLAVGNAATVDTLASHGATGTWLLDPQNIDIVSGGQDGLGGSNIDPGTITNALATTNVALDATQNLTISSAVDYSSSNTFSLLSKGDIDANASVQNSGTGDVNFVAGWDGTTTNPSSFANSGVYGNNGGNLIVGGKNASQNVALGSSGGTTLAEGDNVELGGTNGYAQIGLSNGGASGDIDVNATGDVDLTAGSSFAQIGHGGYSTTSSNSGDINVDAGGNVSLASGAASFGEYAQIGHGGDDSNATSQTGNIDVTAVDVSLTSDEGHTQIGHGGAASHSDNTGNITVNASGDVTAAGGGVDTWGFAIIGSGGDSSSGLDKGDITVNADNVSVKGGGDFGQIGEGGWGSSGTHTGTVTVKATGDIDLEGTGVNTFSYAQIGDGGEGTGGENTGDVSLTAGGKIALSSNGEYAQVGDGGIASSATDSGNITLNAGTDITLTGGPSSEIGYVQVGNGGAGYQGTTSGDINLTATGNVSLTGGGGEADYAQVGNGGAASKGNNSGNITVDAQGNVTLSGGAGGASFAQIGHGGAESNAGSAGYTNSGTVTVSGATVSLTGGTGTGSYAQIGHGGALSGLGLTGDGVNSGAITVTGAEDVSLTGGAADAYAQIGNGGDQSNANPATTASGSNDGDISVTVSDKSASVALAAGSGNDAYAQVGNGGLASNGATIQSDATGSGTGTGTTGFSDSGDILVSDLSLTGSDTGSNAYAQIGNGDAAKANVGDVSGDITIDSNGKPTTTDGTATNAGSLVGNATGNGTVSGTVSINGGSTSTVTDQTAGTVANLIQAPDLNNSFTSPQTFPEASTPATEPEVASTQPASPIQQLEGGNSSDNSEAQPSDEVASSVGQSLSGKPGKSKAVQATQTIIPGVLKQVVLTNPRQPHGIPPADQDYSSWGNQDLWRW